MFKKLLIIGCLLGTGCCGNSSKPPKRYQVLHQEYVDGVGHITELKDSQTGKTLHLIGSGHNSMLIWKDNERPQ